MNIKLLIVDIDGTIMDTAGRIADEDKQALAQARRRGVCVSLCSGRAVIACRHVLDELDLLDGYHVFFDGAFVGNPATGEEVYSRPLRKQVVRRMVDCARSLDISLDFYAESRYFVERESWVTDIRRSYFKIEPVVRPFDGLWDEEKIIKGTLVVRSAEDKARAKLFEQEFKDDLTLSYTKTPAFPDVDFINVLVRGVSKRNAVMALASHVGVPLSQAMAIGDGVNDIPVLEVVGWAVAMGGAIERVKAVADYVTLDVEHCGAAAAIHKFVLDV